LKFFEKNEVGGVLSNFLNPRIDKKVSAVVVVVVVVVHNK